MRNHHRVLFAVASVLCLSGPAVAGNLSYEALDGTRCSVSTDDPGTLDFHVTDDEVFAGISIPLGQPTSTARQQCEQMSRLDQQRNHFMWLQELYEQGVIKRSALVKAGQALGLELAEGATPTPDSSFELVIP